VSEIERKRTSEIGIPTHLWHVGKLYGRLRADSINLNKIFFNQKIFLNQLGHKQIF